MNELISIEEYCDNWPILFRQERSILRSALLMAEVIITHVGSTAVNELAAKPIIDILVQHPSFPPSAETVNSLETIGYRTMGESGVPGRYWFIKGNPRQFHLHFTAIGSSVAKAQIHFRNALRADKKQRLAYQLLKQQAAVNQTLDSHEYADAKRDFITSLLLNSKTDATDKEH